MIKHTVINAELGYALATARHKDAIVICDANMPIPDGCNVIDVSLVRGVPTPIYVNEVFDIIQSINRDGVTVLLVEQNAKKALSIANQAYVLET